MSVRNLEPLRVGMVVTFSNNVRTGTLWSVDSEDDDSFDLRLLLPAEGQGWEECSPECPPIAKGPRGEAQRGDIKVVPEMVVLARVTRQEIPGSSWRVGQLVAPKDISGSTVWRVVEPRMEDSPWLVLLELVAAADGWEHLHPDRPIGYRRGYEHRWVAKPHPMFYAGIKYAMPEV